MFRAIKQVFTALLRFSSTLATKCMSLNNQPCITRPTLIDLNPDECNQGLGHHPSVVNFNRFDGSCKTLDDPSGRICVSDTTGNKNLNVYNLIAIENESKWRKH